MRLSRHIFVLTLTFLLIATSAQAQPTESLDLGSWQDDPGRGYLVVVEALTERGYQIRSVQRTWLNRIRIVARNSEHAREIVVSQATGRILRDVIIEEY